MEKVINLDLTRMLPSFAKKWIEGRENLKKILDNIGWQFIDKAIRMGTGLVVTVAVTRYLGPEQNGILNFSTAFVALFSPLVVLGIDGIIIRDLVNYPDKRNEILGTGFLLKLTGGLSSLLVSVAAIFLIRPLDHVSQLFVFLIGIGIIFQSLDIIDYYFASQIKSKYVVYARNASFILISALKIVMLLRKSPLLVFVILISVEAILSGIFMIVAYTWKKASFLKWKWNKTLAFNLLKTGLPLVLSSILVMIYMNIDKIMLKQLSTDKSVGLFSAAVQLISIWYFFPSAICGTIFPAMLESRKKSSELFYKRTQDLFNLMVWISLPAALLFTLFGDNIILLFGHRFASAGGVFKIYSWVLLFVFLGIAGSQWMLVENLQYLSIYRSIVGCSVNVILNLILIPCMDITGAAIATLVAQASNTYFFDFFNKKTIRVAWMKTRAMLLIDLVILIMKKFSFAANKKIS